MPVNKNIFLVINKETLNDKVPDNLKELEKSFIKDIPLNAVYIYKKDELWSLAINSKPPVYFCPDYNSKLWYTTKLQSKYNKSLLKKALGKNKGNLLDACAGFGKDSFIMASLGFKVTACERNPIIFYMLKQAINNAAEKTAKKLIQPVFQNTKNMLIQNNFWQTIYLDPMFTPLLSNAQVKKPSQFLRAITADDISNNEELFELAENKCNRLVVKRHISSPLIINRNPDIQYKGESTRYDVYLTKSKQPT